MSRASNKVDQVAMGISIICLVHCLALPLVVSLAPWVAAALALDDHSLLHWVMLGLAVPLSGLGLWLGMRRHGDLRLVLLGATGIVFMFVGVSHLLGAGFETPLTVVGVTFVLGAHLLNWRWSRRSHVHAHA
ncbi:MAG: MerC domain-containing protein [Gammaproteobacteria bacterium]